MNIKFSLAVAVICLTLATFVTAQTTTLETSYARWKSEALKHDPQVNHMALTLAAARVESDSVKIDVLSGGKAIDLKLQIQPGKIGVADGRDTFIPAGEISTTSQKLRQVDTTTVGPSSLSINIPATEDLNVIRVTWFILIDGSEKSLQILLPVSTEAQPSTVGVVKNSDK